MYNQRILRVPKWNMDKVNMILWCCVVLWLAQLHRVAASSEGSLLLTLTQAPCCDLRHCETQYGKDLEGDVRFLLEGRQATVPTLVGDTEKTHEKQLLTL